MCTDAPACVIGCVCMCMCVCTCVCARARAHVCVCVCVCGALSTADASMLSSFIFENGDAEPAHKTAPPVQAEQQQHQQAPDACAHSAPAPAETHLPAGAPAQMQGEAHEDMGAHVPAVTPAQSEARDGKGAHEPAVATTAQTQIEVQTQIEAQKEMCASADPLQDWSPPEAEAWHVVIGQQRVREKGWGVLRESIREGRTFAAAVSAQAQASFIVCVCVCARARAYVRSPSLPFSLSLVCVCVCARARALSLSLLLSDALFSHARS